jgi:hypothetical protein
MKFRVPDLVLGALLMVAIFAMGMLFASSLPAPPKHQAEYQSSAEKTTKEDVKHGFWEKTADDPVAYFTLWLMGFTGIMALATIGLGVATILLYRAGNKQLALARQEFIATHRPKVIVRFVQGPFHLDDRRFIFITFVNIGDSEAIIRAIGADLAIWRIGGSDGGFWEPPGLEATPVDLDPTITLASGQRHTVKVTSRSTWGDPQIWADTHDQIQTIAQGAIKYRDLNGVVRETGFSRVLDRFNTFHISKNPEEEYQD